MPNLSFNRIDAMVTQMHTEGPCVVARMIYLIVIPIVYQNELKAILLITIACPELVSGVNADITAKGVDQTK